MTDEELKKKIANLLFETNTNITNQIIRSVEERRTFLTEDKQYYYIMADALIAAGIGDVEEAEHRAEVAERALLNLCVDIQTYSLFDQTPLVTEASVKMQEYLQQAEKELAEERKDD